MARETSPHAGKTVKLKADAAQLGGQEYRVEDWWILVAGESWRTSGSMAAFSYGVRIAATPLPLDDDVLYGKIGNFGYLVHVSEVDA